MISLILAIAFLSVSANAEGVPCEFTSPTNEDFCYWIVVHNTWDISYLDAISTCEWKGSSLAVIRDEVTYETIAQKLRDRIPKHWETIYAWIGNEFNPKTGEIFPPDSYVRWFPVNEPRVESESEDNYFIHLYVSKEVDSEYQGMGNIYKEFYWPATVCEYKLH